MPKVGQPTATKPAPPPMARPTPRIEEERSETLAINLEDLDRMTDAMRQRLITGRVDTIRWLRIGEMEAAVQFTCDLLTAATVCDIIRSHDREVGDEPTRVYVRRGTAWNRLPALAVLTAVEPSGAVVLHPAVFPTKPRAVAAAAPKPQRVQFGVV
jgi:hypothetical protein